MTEKTTKKGEEKITSLGGERQDCEKNTNQKAVKSVPRNLTCERLKSSKIVKKILKYAQGRKTFSSPFYSFFLSNLLNKLFWFFILPN